MPLSVLALVVFATSAEAVLQHLRPLRHAAPLMTSSGTRRSSRRLLPFEDARRVVQRQGFRSDSEFRRWWYAGGRKIGGPLWHMPLHPDVQFREWQGWEDYLGVPLSFSEAKEVIADLPDDVRPLTQEMWWAFSREQHELRLRLRVPARPHLFYRREWAGYDDWLGLSGEPLVFPADWGRNGGQSLN